MQPPSPAKYYLYFQTIFWPYIPVIVRLFRIVSCCSVCEGVTPHSHGVGKKWASFTPLVLLPSPAPLVQQHGGVCLRHSWSVWATYTQVSVRAGSVVGDHCEILLCIYIALNSFELYVNESPLWWLLGIFGSLLPVASHHGEWEFSSSSAWWDCGVILSDRTENWDMEFLISRLIVLLSGWLRAASKAFWSLTAANSLFACINAVYKVNTVCTVMSAVLLLTFWNYNFKTKLQLRVDDRSDHRRTRLHVDKACSAAALKRFLALINMHKLKTPAV